jgi:predicted XRE-type DNA-binding protein
VTGQQFSCVWDAIEEDPLIAREMKLRSELMIALTDHIESSRLAPDEAAHAFGVPVSRVTDLMQGKINRLQLSALINMAVAAGLKVDPEALEFEEGRGAQAPVR